jgi:hypothetical protein
MDTLLDQVLEAHGGLERWQRYSKVEATIITGGGLFPLKGVLQDHNPRRRGNIKARGNGPMACLLRDDSL